MGEKVGIQFYSV